ncbi:MAG: response regulator [Planctomycetota bacterium]
MTPHAPTPLQRVSTTPRRDRAKVLIVEDDSDCSQGWSVWLRHRGFAVSAAMDGTSGLEAIETWGPDVVVLDIRLPGMDGLEVLHEAQARGFRVPIVVASAELSAQTKHQARVLGAEAVLAKPLSFEHLASAIETALG